MKKSELKMMIREIVREEVALTMKEVIKEVVGGKPQPKPQPKPKKKHYSKNKVLNDVLNETATSGVSEEWETLGGSTYTSDRMNEVVGSSYADMMNGNQKPDADTVVKSMGGNPDAVGDTLKNALTRDYSDLMKAMDKKK
tara:strand:+ start:187 stop:606 length:420 start_codon:yes stop_codon:yes gene_type:complete